MSDTLVTLTAGTLPQGYCFTTLQEYYNQIIALTQAALPGTYTVFNFGSNLPDPADQDKPWVRTDTSGNFDRLYTYNGAWVSPHPVPPGGDERRLWVGTNDAAGLWAYDGGDGTDPAAATDTTGSMWMVDTDFALKFPYGADGATVDPGDTGGSASAAGVAHTHVIGKTAVGGADHVALVVGQSTAIDSSTAYDFDTTGLSSQTLTDGNLVTGPATSPTVATLPPYRAVYYIKRSARKYYTVS